MMIVRRLIIGAGLLLLAGLLSAQAQISNPPVSLPVASIPAFNSNTGALITLAAAGAGTTTSSDQTNSWGRSVRCVTDITVAGGVPTLAVTVQGKDTASGKYYTLLASADLATVSTNQLLVGPGLTGAANLVANVPLPVTWRLSAVVGGVTPAVTATIGCAVTQ